MLYRLATTQYSGNIVASRFNDKLGSGITERSGMFGVQALILVANQRWSSHLSSSSLAKADTEKLGVCVLIFLSAGGQNVPVKGR